MERIDTKGTTPASLEVDGNNETHIIDYSPNCSIYVPYGCGETYKNAQGWSKYASRIYEMSEM